MTELKVYEYRSFRQLMKDAVAGNQQFDLTRGSLGIAAILLAVPMVLEMAMESIFALVDIFFVSSLGYEAVAIVGITEAMLTILYALAIGLGMGVTALVARRVGEGEIEQANHTSGQALWLGMAVAFLVANAGLWFHEDLLRLMGATESVIEQGKDYTLVMLCGSVTILYLFLINAIFRGAGDARIAMRSLWLANACNIILDPLLIFGIWIFPELGVMGAAVATTIGRGIGVIYQLYHLFDGKGRIQLMKAHLKPQFELMGHIVKISMGGMLQFLIATASWVILVRIVASFGSAAVAGYTIAIRIILFTILPAWGLANAGATLVGQNLGAGQAARAEKSIWTLAKYNLGFMLAVAVSFILLAPSIIPLFTSDPEVIAVGVRCLTFISYGYGFYAIGMVVVQAFNGAGDTMTPTKMNLVCFWLIQIPVAYALAHYAGMSEGGVFMAILIAQSLLTIVAVWVFRKGYWKEKAV